MRPNTLMAMPARPVPMSKFTDFYPVNVNDGLCGKRLVICADTRDNGFYLTVSARSATLTMFSFALFCVRAQAALKADVFHRLINPFTWNTCKIGRAHV